MIYSLGHAAYPAEDFAAMCKAVGGVCVDVRSHPGSSHSPHFGKAQMEQWLPAAGVQYEWWPDLGGWTERHANLAEQFAPYGVRIEPYTKLIFPKHRIAKRREFVVGQPGFANYGFEDYSYFQTLPEYLGAIEQLVLRGQKEDLIMVCCEGYCLKCHRSMIADHLAYLGLPPVRHLSPRYRKTLLPRLVVGYSEHKVYRECGLPKNRLLRFSPYVLGVWGKHRERFRAVLDELIPDEDGFRDLYDP